MFRRVVIAMLASSNLLPSIYECNDNNKTITAQFSNGSFPAPVTQSSPVVNLLQSLKSGNSRAWAAMRALLSNEASREDMMCLDWHNPPHDDNPNFHPFERLLSSVCHDIGYVLTSLLNVRPIPGWWDEKARQNFMNYFKELLRYFCFAQVRIHSLFLYSL